MVEIMSPAELKEWLKDKPADWEQVIATRSALRVLPYFFASEVHQEWIDIYALGLIRALAIWWAARNIPAHNMVAAADAAADAVSALSYDAGADVSDVRENDCNWLESEGDAVSAARRITHRKLWPAGEPDGWRAAWDDAANRLRALDRGYDVWIEWYERRIKGERAAFAIPGDKGRTEDKAIVIRLADASDEDFWGKGATHVNTTLQSWIDEARIEAQIQEIIRKLRGGASAHYGAQDELDKRAALLAELDRMLGKPPQGRFGIGGNSPPESIDSPSAPVALPQDLRDPIEAISAELEKPEPDALVIAEKAALLHRAFKKLKKMASSAADKAADAFGTAVGTAAGVGLVSYVGLSITGVLPKILDWLAPLIH